MGPSPLRHGRPPARAEESTQFLIVTDRTRLTDLRVLRVDTSVLSPQLSPSSVHRREGYRD